MEFVLQVTANLERESGRYATRVELGQLLMEALDDANPSSLDTEADAVYDVVDWQVEEVVRKRTRTQQSRRNQEEDV